MSKSNGKRPVNKTDGSKAKAKKQMTKSRRADAKKETLVESVLNERNLVVTPVEPLEGTVVRDSEHGVVRIEGKITPEKLNLAKAFEREFKEAVTEILDLAAFTPNPSTLAFVKGANLSEGQVAEMLKAKPWSVFQVHGHGLMKTPDNKLETVQNYCYRLEKAVLNVSQSKQKDIDRLHNLMDDREAKISVLEDREIELIRAIEREKKEIRRLQNQLQNLSFPGTRAALSAVSLRAKELFSKVVSFVTKILSD